MFLKELRSHEENNQWEYLVPHIELITYSMVQDIIWKADYHSAYQKNPFFVEPEGSSPCSQEPSTGPYSESAESSSPHQFLPP